MIVIRATKKVLKYLPRAGTATAPSKNALGDWYINRLVVDRRPLLLILSERSRLAILEPARNLKTLPAKLPELVRRRLIGMHISESQISNEIEAMAVIEVAPTINRSVVGQLVDFAKAVPYYLPEGDWAETHLRLIEERLGETPCLCSGKDTDVIWPDRQARKLLAETWGHQ